MNEGGAGFYGKFRGIVSDNQDPLMIGRIKAKVPDVFGDDECGWAMPCAAFGGSGVGFFAVPDSGAGVWIEFEQGDPDYPIWTGAWWGSAQELPTDLLTPPTPWKKVMIVTPGGNSILIDDTPGLGGITLTTSGGQKLALKSTGIELNDGQGGVIKLTGPKVSINNGALEVT